MRSASKIHNEPKSEVLTVRGYKGIYNSHKYWGKKPVELYEAIIEHFTTPNALVCDPFVGSGVLPSVCKMMGVNFDGCDLNPTAIDVASMFVDPPSKSDIAGVLKSLRAACEQRINSSYMLDDGTVISHIVWDGDSIDEIWTKEKRSIKLLPLTDSVLSQTIYNKPLELKHFQDRILHKNSRINVDEGQKVSDLFTARALQNIDHILDGISRLDEHHKKIARFILTSALGQMSKMVFAIANRRRQSKSDVNQKKYEVGSWVIGYWRPKTCFEINVWHVFEGRANRLMNSLRDLSSIPLFANDVQINIKCEDAVAHLKNMDPSTVDLLVTDPPHSDRIPYLELSEMWNTVLGYSADLENEFIYSNSTKRSKSLGQYLVKLNEIISLVSRVLRDGGIFILIFNTTEAEVWREIQTSTSDESNGLSYLGRFSAEYSAGSVVQDNRKGALTNDWCLVYSKGQSSKALSVESLPSWTSEWIQQ